MFFLKRISGEMMKESLLFTAATLALLGFASCETSKIEKKIQNPNEQIQNKSEQNFVKIELESNPTTGASWLSKIEDESIVVFDYDSYVQDGAPENFVGVGGIQTLVFKCLKPGKTEILLDYGQQWEGGSKFETRKLIFTVDKNLNGSFVFED